MPWPGLAQEDEEEAEGPSEAPRRPRHGNTAGSDGLGTNRPRRGGLMAGGAGCGGLGIGVRVLWFSVQGFGVLGFLAGGWACEV